MLKPFVSLIAGAAMALTPLAAWAAESQHKPYVVLDRSLSQLRADFNANAGKVRLLYIVGPTCGICLRAMSDLQEALYSRKPDDPRMATFVVYVPTLGAREKNVVPASQLISNAHTTFYWEETGIIGRLMQQALGVNIYIWDFYAIYGPRAAWSKDGPPPAPDFYQHQAYGLPSEKRLDAGVFAGKVDEFLTRASAGEVHSKDGGAVTVAKSQ
ncbi:MAG TPA: hypothetical protein VGT07_07535 [Steroidobacteraceae bacterium]|nr:hypothetical protein [Steroidobacteraceae bacterium]